MRGIDCEHSRTLKMLPWPWFEGNCVFKAKMVIFRIFKSQSGSGKHFQGSEMHAIDSPHKNIPIWSFFGPKVMKKSKMELFCATLYKSTFLGVCMVKWGVGSPTPMYSRSRARVPGRLEVITVWLRQGLPLHSLGSMVVSSLLGTSGYSRLG